MMDFLGYALIWILVLAWALMPSDAKPSGNVQPRISKAELEHCATIAGKRVAELNDQTGASA